MLKKRIIPCLDIQEGRTVKGVNFIGIRDAGDPVELAKKYVQEGADELVFLDITATVEKRKTFAALVRRIALNINIPFTVGGGVSSVEDARLLIRSGADKVAINSAAVKRPQLIQELSGELGSQCIVLAIDARKINDNWEVVIHGGRKPTDRSALEWAREAERLGAGEILLTSMDHDGTKDGFALELTEQTCRSVNIPVIASGGAGQVHHFTDLFKKTQASAGLAASIFHFGEIPVPRLKTALKDQKIAIR